MRAVVAVMKVVVEKVKAAAVRVLEVEDMVWAAVVKARALQALAGAATRVVLAKGWETAAKVVVVASRVVVARGW